MPRIAHREAYPGNYILCRQQASIEAHPVGTYRILRLPRPRRDGCAVWRYIMC